MNVTTVAIPGTTVAVTFTPDAYCGKNVHLHDADTKWWNGKVIGLLGSMTGHGRLCEMGSREHFGAPDHSGRTEWFVAQVTYEQAAVMMAEKALAARSE